MKLLFRIVAIILFVVFFGFALKNTQEATLRFFLDYTIHAPLVIMLLGFFAGGAVLGILAMTPTLFRLRRELNRQKKLLQNLQKDYDAKTLVRTQPPQPDIM
jgi:uncharacterized integral membrane protein